MLGGGEQGELEIALAAVSAFDGKLGTAVFAEMLFFEAGENLLGSLVDLARDAGEAGDVDTIALVGRAGDDAMEKDDVVFPFFDRDVEIADVWQRLGQV